MDIDVDATGRKAKELSASMNNNGWTKQAKMSAVTNPKLRVTNPRISSLKLESDLLQISPQSPLVSTALQENAWVCGNNAQNQLGLEQVTIITEPQPLRSHKWKALSIGSSHSAAVGDRGEVYTWGSNKKAQLGIQGGPVPGDRPTPHRMELLAGWDVRAIACGSDHTVAITPTDVITWGSNEHGQCGHGERAEIDWVKPRSLKLLNNQMVTQIICGAHHTMCVTATSVVYTWGLNSHGQLGHGDTVVRKSPTVVEALWALPVVQLAAGESHSAALTSNGFLFTWGGNEQGQLGLPAAADVAQQALATCPPSERRRVYRRVNQRFLQAMAEMGIPEDQAQLALHETGNVGVEVAAEWLFSVPQDVLETRLSDDPGTPQEEVVSLEDALHDAGARVLAPRRVALQGVRFVAAGRAHTVAVTDEEVYAWGDNQHGQLGLGHLNTVNLPTEVDDAAGLGIVQAACGAQHTILICRSGQVYGCGNTKYGALPMEIEEMCSTPASELANELTLDDASGSSGAMNNNDCLVPCLTALKVGFLNENAGPKSLVVSSVIAGDHCSVFLTRAADELPDSPAPRLWEKLQEAVAAAKLTKQAHELEMHLQSIGGAVERVFSSAAAISAAFGVSDKVGLDVVLLDSMQHSLLELEPPCAPKSSDPQPCMDGLYQALRKATEVLIADAEKNLRLLGTPERAQVLLSVAQSPLLGDTRSSTTLIPRVCNAILAAPSSCRHLLIKWWAEYPADLLELRVVKPLQRYLTDELYTTKKLTVSVMNAIKVLSKVEEANQLGRKLPPEAFYNELISEKLDVLDHYVAWRQTHDMPQHTGSTDGPFSFCSYPFLLNPRAKSKLLHTEARIQMDQTVAAARHEHQSGTGSQAREECVVPRVKAAPSPKKPNNPHAAGDGFIPASQANARQRRRDRHGGGIRWLFHSMRHTDTPSSPASPTASGGASPRQPPIFDHDAVANAAATATTSTLWKQGSLGLPAPDDSGFPGTHPEMLILRIRRGHLVQDALYEVARQRPRDLFKPLRVHFIGEDGVDAGGVKKEFFQLLLAEVLNPDYGMLVFQPENRTYWFDPASMEGDNEFLLLGLVVGLAVYNGVLLDFPLPLALYRKILGQEVKLRDLEDMQPTLGRSLRQLLQYEGQGSVEDVFCQTFSIELHALGETRVVPLKPNGENIPVTEESRREFVDLYVEYIMNSSIHRQFEGFAKGFLMLCGGPALQLFSATELERLVCGSPCLDFEALVKSARYEGGYHAEHRVVQWLWRVLEELEHEEKKMFLKFVTGSDRAPIGGLANLKVIIQRDGPDSSRLPTSHTCFNTLLIPSYRTKEKLAERLKLAILNAEGFGLE